MNLRLTGKAAVVTGGSRGIGLAIAKGLAAEGVRVCLVARNEQSLLAAAAAVREQSAAAEVMTIPGDVNDPELPAHIVAETEKRWRALNILVNNAGGPPSGAFRDHEDAAWLAALQQNFLSVVRMTRAAVPSMQRAKWGRIINITSTIAREPTPGMTLSASSRAAVTAFSKAAATELAADGITVNTIAPANVQTDRAVSLLREAAKRQNRSYEDVFAASCANIPARRFAAPAEIADLAVFLASDLAGYITGTVTSVDGGLSRAIF